MDPTTTFLNKLLQVPPEDTDLDTKHHIYVQSKWGDHCTELLMQDSRTNKCYKGQLKKTEMQEAADDLEIDYDTFSAECRSALTTNISLPGFECEIDETEMVFRLTKKQEFYLQYLEVKLKELKNNYELLDTAIQLIESGLKKEEMKVQARHKSDQDYEELLESYRQCVEEKKVWKQQFALLLNSKNNQIVKQQKELQRCRSGSAGDVQQCKTDDMDMEQSLKFAMNSKARRYISGKKCCLAHCNKSRRDFPSIRLFKFPDYDESLLMQWAKKCNLSESFLASSTSLFLCQDHFAPECIGKKFLKRGTIPDRNLTERQEHFESKISFSDAIDLNPYM